MPPHTGEIPYEKRVAIICLRITCGLTFAVIAQKLGLKIPSVQQLYTRALERTDESLRESFVDVAKNVKDAPRSGRPVTNPQKIRPSRKGQSRRSKPTEKRREAPGKPAEEQQQQPPPPPPPLPLEDPKQPSVVMGGVAAPKEVNGVIYGEPVLSHAPPHPQPHGSEKNRVW
jgi:hypothetical protein